jgi:hypothetical protein
MFSREDIGPTVLALNACADRLGSSMPSILAIALGCCSDRGCIKSVSIQITSSSSHVCTKCGISRGFWVFIAWVGSSTVSAEQGSLISCQ